jgi:twitching motility protein PilT
MVSIEELLTLMVQRGGSDLHITAGSPPKIRIDGKLVNTEHEMLTPELTQKLVYSFLNSEQIAVFERNLESDLSFGIDGLGRFRTNVFMQRGAVGAVLRIIPYEIRSFPELGLPQAVCEYLCNLPKGPDPRDRCHGLRQVDDAGLDDRLHQRSSLVPRRDDRGSDRVPPPEQGLPVQPARGGVGYALVPQRPAVRPAAGSGRDHGRRDARRRDDRDGAPPRRDGTPDLRDAAHFRLDPDRQPDRGRLSLAPAAADPDAALVRPAGDLRPAADPAQQRPGRILACEVLIATSAVRALVRDDKAHQVYSLIQTGGKVGMRTMNQSLFELYRTNQITFDDALSRSTDPDDLKRLFQRGA